MRTSEVTTFLEQTQPLSKRQRLTLIDQALILFEQNYVHLPQKMAMYAVDPVRSLQLLRGRVERLPEDAPGPVWPFHRELTAIFNSVRDRHMVYGLPKQFAKMFAYLPIQVEEAWIGEKDRPRYLITRVRPDEDCDGLVPGLEVTHWNGVPIGRAVDLLAARSAGSNEAAQHALGIDALTLRELQTQPPPDEEWVTVSTVSRGGKPREHRVDWKVFSDPPEWAYPWTDEDTAAVQGLDWCGAAVAEARRNLFALTGREKFMTEPGLEANFRARKVEVEGEQFGHLRIFSFLVPDGSLPDRLVAGFVDLLEKLSADPALKGLIIDIRGNNGGDITVAERLLQTLKKQEITPEGAQFINTSLNLAILKTLGTKTPLFEESVMSMEQAFETGAIYSVPYPITSASRANDLGQKQSRPVVLITDGRTYSAADIFAAGFQDNCIGPVLGADEYTGAGGANCMEHAKLRKWYGEVESSPYRVLPQGAFMKVAWRRTLRGGKFVGMPLEDFGVKPEKHHKMTRKDVLEGNQDLLKAAVALMKA